MRKTVLIFSMIGVTLLTACNTAPTASEIVVTDAWARAAAIEESTEAQAGQGMAMGEGDVTETPTEEAAPMGEMAMSGAVSAVYMTIENRGGTADRLIRASTDAAAIVEIHETQIDDQGVGRMRPLANGLDIPAGESVRLEPGGFHVMLMNLQRDLVAGESLGLTLSFESGQEITVEAEIRQP